MMTARRQANLAYIGDQYALSGAVTDMLFRKGSDWLTDEQIEALAERVAQDRRFRERLSRLNRALSDGELSANDVRKMYGLPPLTTTNPFIPYGTVGSVDGTDGEAA